MGSSRVELEEKLRSGLDVDTVDAALLDALGGVHSMETKLLESSKELLALTFVFRPFELPVTRLESEGVLGRVSGRIVGDRFVVSAFGRTASLPAEVAEDALGPFVRVQEDRLRLAGGLEFVVRPAQEGSLPAGEIGIERKTTLTRREHPDPAAVVRVTFDRSGFVPGRPFVWPHQEDVVLAS